MMSALPIRLESFALSSSLDHSGVSILQRSKSLQLFRGNGRFGDLCVVNIGSMPSLPDFEITHELARGMLSNAGSALYTIADIAVSADSATVTKQSQDWLSVITNSLESILKILKDGLSTLHVPYSYGFAIILLTVIVKAATFPFTKKQVESAITMRNLQPQTRAIQKIYNGDQERIQLETARLYKLAGVNPLAGWLPTLATIPIWIGLYRALSNVANEGLLTEGFFWIPSLSGPTTIAARQRGTGTSWLFPFIDDHPPLGWSDTLAYLVLPALLVIAQYISVQFIQSSQSADTKNKSSQVLNSVLPLMIGYFALSVPSGLTLYWLTNNILNTGQQILMQELGRTKVPVLEVQDENRELPAIEKSGCSTDSCVQSHEKSKSAKGPRPGERFRQIKELEERLRWKREGKNSLEEATTGAENVIKGDFVSELESADNNNCRVTIINGSSSIRHLDKLKVATAENPGPSKPLF